MSRIFSVDKAELREKVGSLSSQRVREILTSVLVVIEPKDREG